MRNKISVIRNIRVTTGYDCNCKCRYCTQRVTHLQDRQPTGKGNQIESLYALLKQPHIAKEGTLAIEFEGGEPLLHPEIIRGAVKLCDQLETDTRDIKYNLVSNCQLLNSEKGRDLIHWLNDRGCKFSIAVSFDHEYKHPRIIRPDTYDFIKHCGASFVYPVYVIENKRLLNRARVNIQFLNDMGLTPIVYWNFFAYKELNDISVRREYLSFLKETKNLNRGGIGFNGSIQSCGWVGITPYGKFYSCSEANFGEADLSKVAELDNGVCRDCKIKDYCGQCEVRKALYGKDLCGIAKVQYALETDSEVE